MVALVAIKEPERLQVAVGCLWAAYLAVLASLKMQFVRTVSMALGMAEVLKVPAATLLAPPVGYLLGAKLRHWALPAANTIL